MSSGALGRLSTLTLSVKQLSRLPHLSDILPSSLPSLPSPSPTVPVSCVPTLFQEPYILSGYRPVGQDWRCYVLSLFQRHNESLNVWTHLLAGPLVLLRVWAYGLSLDSASLPLCLYILSALTYLCCSVAAHLLQSHSELAHYTLFFLDYVGVSVYQYGCSLAHYFYCSEPAWRESPVGSLCFYYCYGNTLSLHTLVHFIQLVCIPSDTRCSALLFTWAQKGKECHFGCLRYIVFRFSIPDSDVVL